MNLIICHEKQINLNLIIIIAEEALKFLDTILSYIQNSTENIVFKLKHINSIKAIKRHVSKHWSFYTI